MTTTAQYAISVDWSLDGFTTGDNITSDVLAEYPVIIERGRDQARQLSPPMAGKIVVELDNVTRRYSRENSTGALYGNLLPGRPLKVEVDYDGLTYRLAKCFLSEITPHVSVGERTVTLTGLGALSRLKAQARGQKVSTALYANITTDVALGYILDAVGWPAADRVLDTGKMTLEWWWLNEEDPFDAAAALVATEGPGAALYDDNQGRIIFESRHYRITTVRCVTSQQTFTSTGSPYLVEPFEYNDGVRDIINLCTVEQKVRTQASTAGEVWAAGTSITLGSNETRKVKASASDPFTGAVAPTTAGGDYTISAGSLSTATLDRTSGQNCTLTLTAGSGGATITGLRLRAQTVPVTATNLVSNTVSSTDSQGKYGTRAFNFPVRAEIALNTVQDFANAITGLYKEPRPSLEFTVNGQARDDLLQLFLRNISDRVTIVESQVGTTGDYYIERITHRIEAGGLWHEGRFACEAVWTQPFARWGSTGAIYTRWASTGFTSTDVDKGVWGY